MDKNFLDATKFIGSKIPFWVQGPGGNTSVKLKDKETSQLLIKSTGLRLDQVNETTGLSLLNLDKVLLNYNLAFLQQAQEQDYSDLIKNKENLSAYHNTLNLPSMESGFHISLSKKYVFHFHSLVSHFVFHELQKDAEKVKKWFKENTTYQCFLLPFCYPGLSLSKKLHENADYDIYFLDSHGVILNFDSADELNIYIELEKNFCAAFGLNNLYKYFDKTVEQLLKEFADTRIPFKSYFPDTLVFQTEIKQQLLTHHSDQDTYSLRKDIAPASANLLEIWLATLILYTTNNDLESLGDEHMLSLRNMPTEVTRRNKVGL